MNTVLRYPGSKWRIADQLVSNIPEHKSYLEPYFGSGAVLFNKPPSPIETINDLDDDVINLFQCIRDHSQQLAAMIAAIPYSRKAYVLFVCFEDVLQFLQSIQEDDTN